MKVRCRQHLHRDPKLLSCLAFRVHYSASKNTYSNTYAWYKYSDNRMILKWNNASYKALAITVPLFFPKVYANEYKVISPTYSNRLEVKRNENWFQAEVRKFRTYPHLDRAYRLMNEGRYQDTKKELKQFLILDPKDINVRLMYVTVLYRLKEYSEVVLQANTILKEQPDNASAQLYRGLSRQWMGQLNKAYSDFQNVITNTHANSEDRNFSINAAANLATMQKKPQEALNLIEQIAANKQDFNFHLQRGSILEELKRFTDAKTAYRSALKRANSSKERVKALSAYGQVAQKLKDWNDAHKSFAEALALSPNNLPLMRLLAQGSYQNKDYAEGVMWGSKVLAKAPDNVQDREFIANILMAQKEYRKAIDEYTILLNQSKTDETVRYRAYMSLGYAYSHLKQYSQSVDAFRHAANLQRDELTLLALAEALEHNGQTHEAALTLGIVVKNSSDTENNLKLTSLNDPSNHHSENIESLKLAPNSKNLAEYYFHLANLYEKQGDKAAALIHLNQATHRKLPLQQRKKAYLQQGHIYSQLRQYQSAVDSFRKAASVQPDTVTLLALVEALEQNGQINEAIQILLKVLEYQRTLENYLKLANLYDKSGDYKNEIIYLEHVLHINNLPEYHFRLGMLYARQDNHTKTFEHLNQDVINQLSPEQKQLAYSQQGYSYSQIKNHEKAIEAFREAIKLGKQDIKTYQSLAFSLAALKRWEEAVEQFLLVLEIERSPTTLIQIAHCYKELNRNDLAIKYLNLAQTLAQPQDKQLQKKLYDALGYLYIEDEKYSDAAYVLEKSLTLQQDNLISLRLARVQRLLEHLEQAEKTLHSIDTRHLSPEFNALYADELVQVYGKQGKITEAVEVLKEINTIQPSADRFYRLGLYYLNLGEKEQAITHFESAVKLEPNNKIYKESLAYTYKNAQRNEDAARVFENILSRHPESLSASKDLAYIYMQDGKNSKADKWFKHAIDIQTQLPASTPQQEQRQQDIYKLKKEVTKLNRNVGFSFYNTYRANQDKSSMASPVNSASVAGGVVSSQGGVDFFFQPPNVGLRDDKIFQVFARTLWSNQFKSLNIDRDSLQGGVGARYKPFKTQNFYVAAEQLIKIGANAENNSLLRTSYSWSKGTELQFNKPSWMTTQLYADAGYFLQKGGTWAFYGEARQGKTINISNQFLITPHFVMNGRYQTPDSFSTSHLEAGAGVSFQYLFNDSFYETFRSKAEFLVQYKRRFLSENSQSNNGGWMFTVLIH